MDLGILQYGVLQGARRSWFPRHDSLRITYVVFRRSHFLVMQRGPSTRSYSSRSGFGLGVGILFAVGVREEGGGDGERRRLWCPLALFCCGYTTRGKSSRLVVARPFARRARKCDSSLVSQTMMGACHSIRDKDIKILKCNFKGKLSILKQWFNHII
jgi:hypothetical protein